jgi:Tfp pilus assembly protein PilF
VSDLLEIPVERFVRKFKYRLSHDKHKFAFFLGAGCSVSSGIPASKELVSKWLKTLYYEETGKEASYLTGDFKKWVQKKYPDYTQEKGSQYYGKVIKDLFPHKAERKAEFERLIQNKDPAFGYGVLAQLVGNSTRGEYCNIILTTNFDDLVADALYIYSRQKPLVVAHESLTGFIRLTSKTPIVIKLHGDVILEIENTEDETKQIAEPLKHKLGDILKETGIIFIGYGGNDEGVLKILNGLSKDHMKNGIYWINNDLPDNPEFLHWLSERGAIWVKIDSFDKLMLYLFKEFELKNPDENRFNELMKNYYETVKKLESELKNDNEKDIVKDVIKDTWWEFAIEASKYNKLDPERAEKILQEGLNKFPNTPSLLGSYAVFLTNNRKDYNKAEEYYLKSLELDPKNANTVGNYAVFLENNRKDYNKAEEYYLKSLELDPKNANTIGNYAAFLTNNRKDYNKAEEYYLKSLELDPKNANTVGNYAAFLENTRKDYNKAEEYYLKSLELDPKNANTVGNYAIFLANNRKDCNKAEEYYLKSLELDPENADIVGNYAIFLANTRKDYNKAEEYYLKSLELDPKNANLVGNSAGLLLAKGQIQKGKDLLNRAFDLIQNYEIQDSLLIECYFYRYAHFFEDTDQMNNDYEKITSLLNQGIRSIGWDFSLNIKRAKQDGHPHPEILVSLADRISKDDGTS